MLENDDNLNSDRTFGREDNAGNSDAGSDGPFSMGDQQTEGGSKDSLGLVDRYELVEKLGQGAFGAVYRARDTVADIDVAVKALPSMIAHNAEELERVKKNFQLVSKLSHTNIAAMRHLHLAERVSRAAGERLHVERGDYLVVMEYVPGSTLSAWRKQFPNEKVPVEQATEICRQVAAALDHAHEQKIIHRDIKPSNIMVITREDGSFICKILDFGLAAEIRSSMSRVSKETADTSGTRPYMAPEQWSGKKQGAATDQYALAVLFYELVSGAVPFASAFETNDPLVMMNVAENKTPESLPELSKKQNQVLLTALAKDPDARYPSCTDFVARLGGIATKNTKRHKKSSSKPPVFRWAALLVVLGLLAAGGYYGWQRYNLYQTRTELEQAIDDAEDAKADNDWPEVKKVAQASLPVNEENRLEACSTLYERLEELRDEADQETEQIAELKEKAENALAEDELKTAGEAISELESLGASENIISELQNRKESKSNAREVRNRYGEASVLYERLRNSDINRGQGLGEKVDALEARWKSARSAHDNQVWGEALTAYDDVISRVEEIEELISKRENASDARKQAETAKKKAASENAADLAGEEFDSGKQASSQAKDAYDSGEFAEAEKHWQSAVKKYEEAEKNKTENTLKEAIAEAEAAKDRDDWAEVKKVAQASLPVNEENRLEACSTLYERLEELLREAAEQQELADEERDRIAELKITVTDGENPIKGAVITIESYDKSKKSPAVFDIEPFAQYNIKVTPPQNKQIFGMPMKLDFEAKEQDVNHLEIPLNVFYLPPAVIPVKNPEVPDPSHLAPGSKQALKKQQKFAEQTGLPIAVRTRKEGVLFRLIPPGKFEMGASPSVNNPKQSELPRHTVHLTSPFYIAKFPITVSQWRNVMQSLPSEYTGNEFNEYPVRGLSWYKAVEFTEKLQSRENVRGGFFRLPLEAEWEYACRAGTKTRYFTGDNEQALRKAGWFRDNSQGKPQQVQQKKPNAWGVYDMHGNVWEWCQDYYGKNYYHNSPKELPEGAKHGNYRIIRGGSWKFDASACRSGSRNWQPPDNSTKDNGLRIVLELPKQKHK